MPIKIPTNEKKFSQTNDSDLTGNIWYTKNINFDERGYIKLSPRTIQIDSESYGLSFDTPYSFGRFGKGQFHVVTGDRAFNTDLSRNSTSLSLPDTSLGSPQLDFDSRGVWWQNRWYTVGTAVDASYGLVYFNGTLWTSVAVASLSQNNTHPLEVFRNKRQLAIGDGNTVKLYNTSHTLTATLTLPTDYEVVGLCYSKNNLGIITILNGTINNQNQEAFFFVWNGATASTDADQGYPIGSDAIYAITPYKSSWVVITRAGQLLPWNGGGFGDPIAQLPFYSESLQWDEGGTRSMFGDAIQVDGDKMYVNVSSLLNQHGVKDEVYLPKYPGGVFCYDPSVGLYNRYSPSISPAYQIRVLSSAINTTTNTFTKSAGTLAPTGNPILYTYNRSTLIGGLKTGTVYYIINLDGTDFRLATTKENAIAGNEIDITSTGDSLNYFMGLEVRDYSQSLSSDTGGVALLGSTDIMYEKIIFGGNYDDPTSESTDYATLCLTSPAFANIGYFVTPKITSTNIKDIFGKVFIKYRTLDVGDSIVVKIKDAEVMGIPVTTPQKNNIRCQWVSSTKLTSMADLSEAKAYFDLEKELECEIIAGAAGGQQSQIESFGYSGGTYTITLTDTLDGATNGNYCDILIDNWRELGSITSDDVDGYKEFLLDSKSKWIKLKIELRGVGTTVEELQIVNTNDKPAQ